MQLRQRKLAGSCSPGKQGSTPANATTPAKAPRRGLLPAAGPAAGGTTVPPGATAPEAQPPVPAAGTTAADLPAGAAAQDAALVVPTPEATGGQSSAAKRKRGRLPPVDIGIPALLLGQGGEVADVAAAADAVDALPLGRAGFLPQTLAAARDYLLKADPKLAPIIAEHGVPERLLKKAGPNFPTLAKAIVFQQLATTAAAKIYGRVLTACGCAEVLTPDSVLAAPMADLRAAGLSERKACYIQDLAAHFADGRLSDAKIAAMDEATLERELCAIKGIGVWTCHMHAIFHLGSPDVLPVGDLGVRKGMQMLYGLKELPSADKMHRIAQKWRPFASLGSYYMWKVQPEGKAASSSKAKKAKR